METALYLLKITTLLAANWLVANALSWLLTEWKRPLFKFKPFSCRPCMSFWLTCITGAPLVLFIADEWQYRSGAVITFLLALTVLLSAFLNYVIINSKIQINE